jgi:hypothetical protein
MPEHAVPSPTDVERRHIQEIIDRHAPAQPEGVRRVELVFGEDWTGHPAVYVNLFVSKDVKPTKIKVAELNDYIKILHDDIIEADSEFWPYSRIFED